MQHLNNLLENYLEPLKKETFLSLAEINALFGNIQEIVTFQRQFLHNLDEAIEMEPDFHKFDHPNQFKVCAHKQWSNALPAHFARGPHTLVNTGSKIQQRCAFFQNVLFSVGSAFLYYVNHFKLYSSFCASHSKAQKVLHPSEYTAPRAPPAHRPRPWHRHCTQHRVMRNPPLLSFFLFPQTRATRR